jgi:hypothetical protein
MTEEIAKLTKQEKPKVPEQHLIIKPEGLTLFEVKNNSFIVTGPVVGTPQDLESNTSIWWAVAHIIKPYDSIRVIAHDETWVADVLVLVVSTSFTRVKLLHVVDLVPADAQEIV